MGELSAINGVAGSYAEDSHAPDDLLDAVARLLQLDENEKDFRVLSPAVER